MIETGLFVVKNAETMLHYAVDMAPDYIGVAVFEIVAAGVSSGMGGILEWASLKSYLETPPEPFGGSGAVDLYLNETFVPDMPHLAHGAIYKGRSYLFLQGAAGEDELVDYSLIDIPIGFNGQPRTWRNRFAQSSREKIANAPRFRQRERVMNALTLAMPIKAGSTSGVRAELICAGEPVYLNGTAPSGYLEEAGLENSGQRYRQFFFSASGAPATVSAGETVDVPFQLFWNGSGDPVERELTFKLDADAGYLPRRRVTTDAMGRGIVSFCAQGLVAGECAQIKINAEHFTALGKLAVEVV